MEQGLPHSKYSAAAPVSISSLLNTYGVSGTDKHMLSHLVLTASGGKLRNHLRFTFKETIDQGDEKHRPKVRRLSNIDPGNKPKSSSWQTCSERVVDEAGVSDFT